MEISRQLARTIPDYFRETQNGEIRSKARMFFGDCFAVMLAGAGEETVKKLVHYAQR